MLLDPLKKRGIRAIGVDPASNLRRHDTINGYFDDRLTLNKLDGEKFDVITACNVFAHIANVLYDLLNPWGVSSIFSFLHIFSLSIGY